MNNNNKILFSIIIPTFNRADIIHKPIKSIIEQSYSNWELIIVDDGSTDDTKEVVSSFSAPRIKYFYKKNEERSIARNYGIDKATGEYISFLDDDDYYLPDFLKVFYNKIIELDDAESAFMCYEYTEKDRIKTKNNIPNALLDNPLGLLWNIQTSIRPFAIHHSILKSEKFKKECKFGQDFHLAIRIAQKFEVYIIQEYLSVNVIHKNQGTHSKFINNYRKNAELSIMCISDLLENHYNQLIQYIAKNELYDLHNHKVYGFASAAMKQCDFEFWWYLLKKINFSASIGKVAYYIFSLSIRGFFNIIKCIFKSKYE